MKLASIDIGTNSMRLLIADYNNKFIGREKFVDITRIGRGVDQQGLISEEAMERNLRSLKNFVDKAREQACEEIFIMGTSALRDSKNREDFVQRAKKETGLPVDIISGEEEALLGFYGVSADLQEEGHVLIVDIGGGSTEFILGEKKQGILFTKSENIGSVRLSEKFVASDPPAPEELETMSHFIRRTIQETVALIRTYPIKKLIGIGGTATSVSSMVQQLEIYDSDKVHQSLIFQEEIESLFQETIRKTLQERMQIPGLQPERADVIIAGMNILRVIMDSLSMREIVISEYDNLEGLIYRNYGL